MIVISPHLDDAVFSCGTLIAAAALLEPVTVVTVFAGIPPAGQTATLDLAAGFTTSEEAMKTRRAEDRRALAVLGAEPVHLDHLDLQYTEMLGDRDAENIAAIREAVGAACAVIRERREDEWDSIVGPLGIRHADHKAVAVALLGITDLVYEELPYRVLWPEQRPPVPEPTLELALCPAKEAAILCYRSQLGDGPPGPELAEHERYHRTD